MPTAIYEQAKVALEEADAIILVVDARTELASPDIELARRLLRSGKPLFLAVNKIDTAKMEAHAEDFHRLGIRNLFPISAENGNGVAELLDAVLPVLPELKTVSPEEVPAVEEQPVEQEQKTQKEIKIAIIGRPNVGKSTLLNALTGSERAIVSPVAGTTRDAVDELVVREDARLRFIDTAGIRRKGKTKLMAEKMSVVMARKHLEAADIALMVIDATEGVTALDANIAGYAHESGRSVIIVINKWDLVTSARTDGKPPVERNLYEQDARDQLKFLTYAPFIFISATTGRNVEKIFSHPDYGGARAAETDIHRRDEPLLEVS